MKAQSFRFRGGVARVAAWHGRADVASLALHGRGAARPPLSNGCSNASAQPATARWSPTRSRPGASLPLVDVGFAVRGRLHLLVARLRRTCPPTTRRTRRARRSDRDALLAADAAAFDEFWRFDAVGLREAGARRRVRTCGSHAVRSNDDRLVGYALFGRADDAGYVQRLAVAARAQGHGLGPALARPTGCAGCAARRDARVRQHAGGQRPRVRALRAGRVPPLPVGLCVLGRRL